MWGKVQKLEIWRKAPIVSTDHSLRSGLSSSAVQLTRNPGTLRTFLIIDSYQLSSWTFPREYSYGEQLGRAFSSAHSVEG